MEESNINNHTNIKRRKTRVISVGDVKIGGDNEVVLQTMTNTQTSDKKSTIDQIIRCVNAGAQLVRVSVPDTDSTNALSGIVKASPVPIIADVHFHYKRGIEALKAGAKCIRINPGTLFKKEQLKEIVKAVKIEGASIRIGVNAGSLEEDLLQKYKRPCPEALSESAMRAVKLLEDADFFNTKISVKASDVMLMVKSYQIISQECDYPLHLGVTEAGTFFPSSIKSAIGIGSLLLSGIGDTIRVSSTVPPEEELPIAWEIVKSLGLRKRGVNIISCPSCSRQQFDVIKIVNEVERRTKDIEKHIEVSILGCVVNGIGEALYSQIGVTGAGSGNHLIYLNGKPFTKVKTENLADRIVELIRKIETE